MTRNCQLKLGDWVKGVTKNDELFHGYLEHIQSSNPKAGVKVVMSDHEEIIGKTLRLEKKNIEKMETVVEYTDQQLQTLIDLALSSGDQRWFQELSSKLKARRQSDQSSGKEGCSLKNDYTKTRY